MRKKKYFTFTSIVILALIIISFCVVSKTVLASNNTGERTKIITSIQIEKGDTLWDIADMYYTDDYNNINEYIHEIKDCNDLDSDTIHEGQYLIIPHFVPESVS